MIEHVNSFVIDSAYMGISVVIILIVLSALFATLAAIEWAINSITKWRHNRMLRLN